MTVNVLILGEGATDVGKPNSSGQWQRGCVLTLIEKINQTVKINFFPVEKSALPKTLSKKNQKKFEGHGKNIQKLIIYSELNKINHDIVVYYGDTDKTSGTKNTPIQAKNASQVAYLQAYDALHFFGKEGFAIIPLRMLECWLLSDDSSYVKTFGTEIKLPSNPEFLWGDKHDPASNYPKNILERILNNFGSSCSNQTFCELMKNIDLAKLYKKCPISVPPFLDKAKACLSI
jgi:hypothetical protein